MLSLQSYIKAFKKEKIDWEMGFIFKMYYLFTIKWHSIYLFLEIRTGIQLTYYLMYINGDMSSFKKMNGNIYIKNVYTLPITFLRNVIVFLYISHILLNYGTSFLLILYIHLQMIVSV